MDAERDLEQLALLAREEVARLQSLQSGLVSRRQALEAGLTRTEMARRLRRGEWLPAHPGVYLNHNGPRTWLERAWAAVLWAWPAGLAGPSALRAYDGPGRHGRDDDPVHIAVARHRNLPAPPGVVVHRTAHLDARVTWNLGPPRLRFEEAVLDHAAAAPDDLAAVAVLADACGGRRTTAARLLDALDQRTRVPRRAWLRDVLADVADGTCSVLEHGYLDRVERPHGLPLGTRQSPRASASGLTWQDVSYNEWALVVELDGRAFHTSSADRDRDLERDLDSMVERAETTVRLGYGQVFGRPCATAIKVGAVLRRLGWSGTATRCPLCGAEDQAA